MAEDLILRTENICKSFNGIQVLKNVNLEIRKGEIHALMGENGAGKSTIIKIITGVYTKDDGEIYIDGQHVQINNRHDAAEAGISVIYQELSLEAILIQRFMGTAVPETRGIRGNLICNNDAAVIPAELKLEINQFDINLLQVSHQQVIHLQAGAVDLFHLLPIVENNILFAPTK